MVSTFWEYVEMIVFLFFFLNLFLFETERETMSASGVGAEGERILSGPHAQCTARHRAWSQDPGIVTWAEIKSQMPHWPSPPQAPRDNCFSYIIYYYTFSDVFPNYTASIYGWILSWSRYSFHTFLNPIRLYWLYLNIKNLLCNRCLWVVHFGRPPCSPPSHQPSGCYLW